MPRCCTEGRAIARRLAGLLARSLGIAALSLACGATGAVGLDLDHALRTSQAVVGKPVGEYTLTRTDGSRVSLSGYRGKPLVVNFVYTGCSQVCPTAVEFLARALRQAHEALGTDAFNAVTIGFNPPFDNPSAMGEFARRHGLAAARWDFLAPDAADVPALTRDFGFAFERTQGGFDHVTQLTIVDPGGRVARQIYGESFELPMLVTPLRDLIAGSPVAKPTLAALVERVRILCTVYDPASGRYRLNYGLFIEILTGISVIGAVVFYLVNEWRRQRRPAPRARDASPSC
jgi:protein SCO1/2